MLLSFLLSVYCAPEPDSFGAIILKHSFQEDLDPDADQDAPAED